MSLSASWRSRSRWPIGVATGVGAATGLVTAVVAGVVAGVLGGSHLQVAVVYPVAVLAGVLVVAAALLRLGRLLTYVPWPLIEGFTLGIAVVIAAAQVPAALGVDGAGGGNVVLAAGTAVLDFLRAPGVLEAVGTLRPLLDRGHVFDDLDAAVAHAGRHVALPAVP